MRREGKEEGRGRGGKDRGGDEQKGRFSCGEMLLFLFFGLMNTSCSREKTKAPKTHACTHTHTHTQSDTHTHTQSDTHAHTHTERHTRTHTHRATRTHIDTHVCNT